MVGAKVSEAIKIAVRGNMNINSRTIEVTEFKPDVIFISEAI